MDNEKSIDQMWKDEVNALKEETSGGCGAGCGCVSKSKPAAEERAHEEHVDEEAWEEASAGGCGSGCGCGSGDGHSHDEHEGHSHDHGEEKKGNCNDGGCGSGGCGKMGKEEDRDMKVNFTSYIWSMSYQSMIFLGDIPNPATGQHEPNLRQAKFLIETLALIKEKTQGNLMPDESEVLSTSLYELQMRFVQLSKANA